MEKMIVNLQDVDVMQTREFEEYTDFKEQLDFEFENRAFVRTYLPQEVRARDDALGNSLAKMEPQILKQKADELIKAQRLDTRYGELIEHMAAKQTGNYSQFNSMWSPILWQSREDQSQAKVAVGDQTMDAFDLDYIDSTNCDGVGLYRTEIPFMASETMPDVEKQISYYKELMDKAGDRKVIFRSLDVGSDKLLPYWAGLSEENPAIGWRSIRITLDRRAILRKQIRAFLEAAAGKELNVMFPMISNLAEFEEAKETLLLELDKEKRFKRPVPAKVNVGLMIEVPSVVFQLEEILEQADFISVGTNDLAQFFFACDRGNPRLTERYDVLSAPFLRLMHKIVTTADAKGVYCSVCGEMASNPIEAMALIGLGFRNLSSSGSAYGRVKSMIRTLDVGGITDYVRRLLDSRRKTLRPQLIAYAYDHGVEIF